MCQKFIQRAEAAELCLYFDIFSLGFFLCLALTAGKMILKTSLLQMRTAVCLSSCPTNFVKYLRENRGTFYKNAKKEEGKC